MANIEFRPHYQIINGIRLPASFSPTLFKEALNYKPKPGDIFISTYPKCGTTWMQNIALYIFRKGREVEDSMNFYKLCPFIDFLGNQGIYGIPRPGVFKTHLPYTHIPYSPDAKYIYVLRNPKDCCVSLYYHTKCNPVLGYWEANFDGFFELFMAGEVKYNDYFDHVDSWYPHRNDKQVFFTTFERMKEDTKAVILKLATFLGQEYIEAIEKDNNVLNNILHFTGLDYMKNKFSRLYDFSVLTDEEANDPNLFEGIKHQIKYIKSLNPPTKREEVQFVRKGIIGDWKTHLSEEQSERLNEKFFERTRGTEIEEMLKIYM